MNGVDMTDRELLELAGKAAGVEGEFVSDFGIRTYEAPHWNRRTENGEPDEYWNPLTNDGDALRLAAMLKINIRYGASFPACDSGASVFAKTQIGYCKPAFEANQSFANTHHRFRILESETKFAEYMCRTERCEERWLQNECVATRRAIVRAAAEIGKAMP